MFHQLQCLKLNDIYKLEMAKLMYRINNNMISSTKANNFQLISQCHDHGTRLRNNLNYCLPRVRTKLGQSMTIFSGKRIWNDINKQLKELSFRTLKKTFKNQLISKYHSTTPDIADNYAKWQHFAIPYLPNSFGGCQILTIRFILKCFVTTLYKSGNSYPVVALGKGGPCAKPQKFGCLHRN